MYTGAAFSNFTGAASLRALPRPGIVADMPVLTWCCNRIRGPSTAPAVAFLYMEFKGKENEVMNGGG